MNVKPTLRSIEISQQAGGKHDHSGLSFQQDIVRPRVCVSKMGPFSEKFLEKNLPL